METAFLSRDQKGYAKIHKEPFRLAAICLYLSAKYEDHKYPYFDCYKELLDAKTFGFPENKEVHFRHASDIVDLELFIWKHLHFNLTISLSAKFFERFAKCAFYH